MNYSFAKTMEHLKNLIGKADLQGGDKSGGYPYNEVNITNQQQYIILNLEVYRIFYKKQCTDHKF